MTTARSPARPATTEAAQPPTTSAPALAGQWMHRPRAGLLALAVASLLSVHVAPDRTPVVEEFSGADGVFVSADDFWSRDDRGLARNQAWFAEGGTLLRQDEAGRTRDPVFRMWTRRTDLAYATVTLDLRFEGWAGGAEEWHGINVWLNRTLCTPVPGCEAVDDDGGNSGYALDALNRDGSLTILKQVQGDTRTRWPEQQVSFTQGGTYYVLAATTWSPVEDREHRFEARAIERDEATVLQVLVDGQLLLEAVDDGTIGGPRLRGGRVGVRSDHAQWSLDDLSVAVEP